MKPCILVVEDEPGIADTITCALQTEGMDSRRSATGSGALELLGAGRFDLIILDIGLPDINGFDLCRAIRRTSPVPVNFLTARVKAVLRRSGGAVSPDSPDERATPRTGERPSLGRRFAVDHRRRSIRYFGHDLELSRYEYQLLELLIKRPGWVFSREQLKHLIWDEPEAGMDRTVDTHIKTIRAKLKQIKPDVNPIKTHRGIGYSMRESW